MATGGVAAAALMPMAAGLTPAAAAADEVGYDAPTINTMGTLGVLPTETARLSVVMYPGSYAGWLLCDGFLAFLSLSGETVATAKFELSAGRGAYLDWSPRGKLTRTQVYPVVTVTTDMSTGDYSDVVMGATFEVFDRLTQVTRTSLVGVLRSTPTVGP